MDHPIISADSHVPEPPDAYLAHIDPKWRARAPRGEDHERLGYVFHVDGFPKPIPIAISSAAGKPAEKIRAFGTPFAEMHRSGWDGHARRSDQERDGVDCEVIYPSVGMLLCNHPDFDYKHACFEAYNRWLAEFCAAAPDRLIGCGQTAMRSPDEGIQDLVRIREAGLRGVMMPGNPAQKDYDAAIYDPFWEAAVDLGLPLAFHVLTSSSDRDAIRGPRMNAFLAIVRGCQDIIGTLILGGVFERHPRLKVVCVEADAGWVPHYTYRMDHAYERHRYWLPPGQELSRLPSEYFADNIYVTFQDDWVAFQTVDLMNWRRLMWANDFPHSDSTWPRSQDLLAEHGRHLRDEQRRAILCDNVAGLYGIDLAPLRVA